MRLWLVCCVLLFMTAQGYDWVSHHGWLHLQAVPLPWMILGGVGLAIASNRSTIQHLRGRQVTPPPLPTVPPVCPPSHTPTAIAPPDIRPSPPRKSISFEIPQHQRSRP